LFKKSKSKLIKLQIQELRSSSKKLRKKDLSQKSEKGKIAKEIKRLKLSLRKCKDIAEGDK
jgi:hypothetical protein